MKATIYALVDPNTHQVCYVGRTTQTAAQRLQHHIGAAKRGKNKHQVYTWIRSLHPVKPILVILREGIDRESRVKQRGMWKSLPEFEETKWKKRLERSPLLCAVPRNTETYRTLINFPGTEAIKTSAVLDGCGT